MEEQTSSISTSITRTPGSRAQTPAAKQPSAKSTTTEMPVTRARVPVWSERGSRRFLEMPTAVRSGRLTSSLRRVPCRNPNIPGGSPETPGKIPIAQTRLQSFRLQIPSRPRLRPESLRLHPAPMFLPPVSPGRPLPGSNSGKRSLPTKPRILDITLLRSNNPRSGFRSR